MRRCLVCVLLSASALAPAGCGGKTKEPPPATYPVRGKVVYRDGTPAAGGAVEFRPAQGRLTSLGDVGPDGTFTLTAVFGNQKLEGAVAGAHAVTYLPAMGADQNVEPVNLPRPVTVKPDGGNDFTLTVPRPRRP
jgi:hypothetical protein